MTVKTILIYEIATDRLIVEYQLNIPDESTELESFNIAWNKAIVDGLVKDKDRSNYALQFLNAENKKQ